MAIRIGSALFNGDHLRLADEIARLEAADVDFLHLDVFDGHFVPDLGFPVRTVAAIREATSLPLEVHLAAVDPMRFIPQLGEAGTDITLFHIESVPMAYEALFTVREHGMKAGVVLTLGTPLALLEPIVPMIDAVLLLARVTGEGTRGASFNDLVYPRVEAARGMIDDAGATVDLQVAGGVNRDHIERLVAAGADTVALGSGLYKVPDMAEEVRELRSRGSGSR